MNNILVRRTVIHLLEIRYFLFLQTGDVYIFEMYHKIVPLSLADHIYDKRINGLYIEIGNTRSRFI